MESNPFYLKPSTGRDFVTLIPRDPDWGYVFWEVTAAGVSRSKGRLARFGYDSALVLRVYSFEREGGLGRSKVDFGEYEVDQWLGGRMVLLGRPGNLHQAVLGFLGGGDTFSPLCRSRFVRSPQTGVVRPDPPRYLRVQPPMEEGGPLQGTFVELDELEPTEAAQEPLESPDPTDRPDLPPAGGSR